MKRVVFLIVRNTEPTVGDQDITMKGFDQCDAVAARHLSNFPNFAGVGHSGMPHAQATLEGLLIERKESTIDTHPELGYTDLVTHDVIPVLIRTRPTRAPDNALDLFTVWKLAIVFQIRLMTLMRRNIARVKEGTFLWVSHGGVIETVAQDPANTPMLGHGDILQVTWEAESEESPYSLISTTILRCPIRSVG